ncbi:unnamed protein product, partial [Brassica rapa subsp. narinosa]
IIFRIEENSIALPITDKKHDKREIIPHADDWDDVGISMISEISEISEVLLIKENTEPSSDCSTPLSKRKENDADLPDLTSTSKKICLNQIKLEKTKTD